MGSSKKRAKILVTLEDRYNEALAPKETLAQKAQAGIRLMESFLNKVENGVHAVRSGTVGRAGRRMEGSRHWINTCPGSGR